MRISDWSSDVCSSDLVGEAAEGDRPARLLHRCDAMLPLVPGFTSEVIDAARRERRTGPLELPVHTAAQPQAGRGTERDADDVLEHRAVLVPANAGTGIVANDQRLDRKSTRLNSSH